MSTEPQRPIDVSNSDSTSGETIPPSARPPRRADSVSLTTLIKFLFGNRDAIETIATSKPALWLGLAFVILAGFFREYDQESLLHAPWHYLIPLLASTLLARFMLTIVQIMSHSYRTLTKETKRSIFRQLLTCLWMTAPLAAIYAIPVERMSSEIGAIKANLYFLLTVSVWRVLLFSRVLSVLFEVSFMRAFFPVMMLSSALALMFSVMIPLPLLQIMGGIRLTEAEQLINEVRINIISLVFFTAAIWVGASLAIYSRRCSLSYLRSDSTGGTIARSAWIPVLVSTLIMVPACLWAQPEQIRKVHFEQLLKQERDAEAIAYLNQRASTDFPPYWDATEHLRVAHFFRVLQRLLETPDVQPWVTELFSKKLKKIYGVGWFSERFWRDRTNDELSTLATLIEQNNGLIHDLSEVGYSPLNRMLDRTLQHQLNKEDENKYPGPSKEELPVELLQRLIRIAPDTEEESLKPEALQKLLDELIEKQQSDDDMPAVISPLDDP